WLTSSAEQKERELKWWHKIDTDCGRKRTPQDLVEEFHRLIVKAETATKSPHFVVGLCAYAKGGDNEFARLVGSKKHFARVSFGKWLEAKAKAKGIAPTRVTLQKLGNEMMHQHGALFFCLEVLKKIPSSLPEETFVIDGIRHK